MEHPESERLAAVQDPEVLAHIAECDECRAVVASVARAQWEPVRRPVSWWTIAVALWLMAVIAGILIPLPQDPAPSAPRTYLHIDFEQTEGYVLAEGRITRVEQGALAQRAGDGWSAVSVKLSEPLLVQRECTLRMRVATNAGFVIASLYPLGRDATYLKIDPQGDELSTLTASVRPGEKVGTTLQPGDKIDWITIAAPTKAETFMLVKAIELESK